MAQNAHEIRDPIHAFIRLDGDERRVLDSRPFQRLRHIHQLALTYLVYPGATHKRFEHSLGVMELAGRVFDVVMHPDNLTDEIRAVLGPLSNRNGRSYWRRVLRIAALCHDMGHLPFSHAAEKQLLPEKWDHERLTREIIASPEMCEIWNTITPPVRRDDIIKLAVGPKKASGLEFTDWEAILSEIIIGDAFGVDRIDYLLRDSHHAGVAYGRFDHYRLIDTLRILPADRNEGSQEPALGVDEGGVHSTEALMLARYFMYSQVYFHPVRRIYDIHLLDFLREWLEGEFPVDVEQHLEKTDVEVTVAMREALQEGRAGHRHACRIIQREHFKRIYERNPNDIALNPEAGRAVFDALCSRYGPESVRRDHYSQEGSAPDFPVRMRDGRTVSSLVASDLLKDIPVTSVDYVFVDRARYDDAGVWMKANLADIIMPREEGAEDG